MRHLALLLLLAPGVALAGAGSSEGSVDRAATRAATTLYVDSTGNDTNTCTATGVGACLTIQGAINKLPRRIRHPVTISVAAGNFKGANVIGFQYEPEDSLTAVPGAGIQIVGTMGAVTPATGNATGTITSSATTGSGGHVVITDSGQSWTVNDLRGKFLKLTSGSGSGTSYPIEANTATTVTIPLSSASTTGAGVTYSLVTPTTVINTAVQAPTVISSTSAGGSSSSFNFLGNPQSLYGSWLLKNLNITAAGVVVSDGYLRVYEVSFTGITTTTTVYMVNAGTDGQASVQRSTIVSSNASGANYYCTLLYNGNARRTIQGLQNNYVRGCNLVLGGVTSVTSNRVENTQAFGGLGLFDLSANSNLGNANSIDCGGGAGTIGLAVGWYGSINGWLNSSYQDGAVSVFTINPLVIENCAVAVSVARAGKFYGQAVLSGTGNTIGVEVREGGLYTQKSTTTLTGATADVQIDGTNFSLATIRALNNKRVMNLETGSIVVEP